MIQNFEYVVFTSAPCVLPEQNIRYRIQPWKVNEIQAYKKVHGQCLKTFLDQTEKDGRSWINTIITRDESRVLFLVDILLMQILHYSFKAFKVPGVSMAAATGTKQIDPTSRQCTGHVSLWVHEFLMKQNIPTLLHTLYSPDMVLCNFHLFPN